MLHIRKSLSAVCAANMSDFCLDEEACQASAFMGDGALAVLRVCRIVNEGCRPAIRIEPF
jgi:hypothetical protein